MRARDHLEDLDVACRIVLKLIFKKQRGGACTVFIGLKIRVSVGGGCWLLLTW